MNTVLDRPMQPTPPSPSLMPRRQLEAHDAPGQIVDTVELSQMALAGSAAGRGTYEGDARTHVTAGGSISYPGRLWGQITEPLQPADETGRVDVNQSNASTEISATINDQHGYSYGVDVSLDKNPSRTAAQLDKSKPDTWDHMVTINGKTYPARVINVEGADGRPNVNVVQYYDASDPSRAKSITTSVDGEGRHRVAFNPPCQVHATQDPRRTATISDIGYSEKGRQQP